MNENKILVPPSGPKTKLWIERYRAAISKSLWHTTIFAKGEGVYVTDLDEYVKG